MSDIGTRPSARPGPCRFRCPTPTLALGLLLLIFVGAGAAQAQEGIGGTVVDGTTQRPLIGAQVVIDGTELGTITDNRGRFLILNVPGVQATVRVIMIGYRVATVTAQVGTVDLLLEMAQTAVSLDEIVVTGTVQAQLKRSLGTSVGRVEAAQMEEIRPAVDVQQMLSSSVPGVRVMLGGGEVGSGGNIRIRGASSLSLASQPLLYVDGVRVNDANADRGIVGGVGVDSRWPPSRINDLNPDDIESIEIIKGPAAATLYGTEASNGVINVITKRGARGAPRFSLTVKQGAAFIPDVENVFPDVYYRSDAGQIVAVNVLRSDRVTGEYPGDDTSYGPWFRTGNPRSYGGTVSGGSERLAYYFSGDWDRDEGPVVYNWKNKLSARANLNYTPNDRLDVNFGFGYTRSKMRSAGAQQPVTTAIIWGCPSPGCEPGRELPNGIDGPFRGYIAYLPERYEDDIEGYENLDRNTLTATINHRPTDWLAHRLTVGGDFTQQNLTELFRRIDGVGSLFPNGRKSLANSRTAYVNADYSASGTFQVTDALRSETSVGLQYYIKRRESQFSQGDIFPVRQLETVTAGALKSALEDFLENKTIGAYIQQQASWRDRFYLTAAVRGDDNSAFGKNYDFVLYPKVSASWVVSDEDFFGEVPVLSTLKLRSAWGKAGTQPDVFAALRSYEPQVGEGGTPTLTPENLGNPDLEPEVSQELEVGFDASLFDDRIGMEFSYYNKKTKSAIVQVPATPSSGFPGFQFTNVGEVANSGWELGVSGNVFRGEDAQVDLGFTFSTNQNEVTDIGEIPFILQTAFLGQYHVPGFPMATFFHKRVVSADLDTSGTRNVATNAMCEGGDFVTGTPFSAGGGAPVPCDQAPRVPWGNPLPRWEGSFSGTVTLFRDLQLFTLLDFVGDYHMSYGDVRAAHMSFRNTRAILERMDPILLAYDDAGIGNTRRQPGLMNGGFAKLRAVSATYTMPEAWIDMWGASRTTLTLSGENLWTIWVAQESDFGHDLMDPERRQVTGFGSAPGTLNGYVQEGWPNLRRFLATLRVTF